MYFVEFFSFYTIFVTNKKTQDTYMYIDICYIIKPFQAACCCLFHFSFIINSRLHPIPHTHTYISINMLFIIYTVEKRINVIGLLHQICQLKCLYIIIIVIVD